MMTTQSSTDEREFLRISPRAAEELRRLMEQEQAEGIRLGVRGGGCSGLSYSLDFSAEREGDHVVDADGIRLFMDRKSAIYLKGVHLDYKEGLKGKGFAFSNPNASNTCGCGESFSI
jgi:iron-sulfur cluster assembly protein